MARPRAADHDEHRDRILARAVHAFAQLGYPSATMADLAHACGLSKAALYHYFPGKEALLQEALERHTARLLATCDAVAARDLSPAEALRALVRALLADYRDSRDHHAALINDVRFLEAPAREAIRAQERAVVGRVADAIDAAFPGRVPPAQRTPTTMALLGMINFTFAWLRPDGPMSYERFADLVIDLWWRGLSGEAPRDSTETQG